MSISFDFNFWTMAIFALNFSLAIYGITAARGRASAEALERIKSEFTHALDAHKEKTGMTFNRLGERLQAVETGLKNSISHEDISAVHRRVDEMHRMLSDIKSDLGKLAGFLEGMKLESKR